MAQDEALLEYPVGGSAETAAPSEAPSPILDAMDVNSIRARVPLPTQPLFRETGLGLTNPDSAMNAAEVDMAQMAGEREPWWGFSEADNSNLGFPIDWTCLLGESGDPSRQSGDPTMFWSQL